MSCGVDVFVAYGGHQELVILTGMVEQITAWGGQGSIKLGNAGDHPPRSCPVHCTALLGEVNAHTVLLKDTLY